MNLPMQEFKSQESLLCEIEQLSTAIQSLEHDLGRMHRLATLGTLAGAIAHEFNNILTPVLSYAQLALSSPGDRELTAKALQKAVAGTERAAHVASSMLGFVREGNTESAHILEVAGDAIGCIAPPPAREGIEIQTNIPAGIHVRMNPVGLTQVILNLLLNAIQAIRPKSGTIWINCEHPASSTGNADASATASAATKTQDESLVILTITDTGSGIPQSIRETLFQPFVRGDTSNRAGNTGTGLGLSICHRLVTEAGGSIEISQADSGGACFRIILPFAKTADESLQSAA